MSSLNQEKESIYMTPCLKCVSLRKSYPVSLKLSERTTRLASRCPVKARSIVLTVTSRLFSIQYAQDLLQYFHKLCTGLFADT